MKKIAIVLLMALALVSIVAAEATVTGEFEWGMMANSASILNEFDKVEFDFNATIDDYNTFSAELEAAGSVPDLNVGNGNGYVDFTWAEVTTDWGKLLDLPVGLTTTTGYDGFGYLDDGVTGWGFEDVVGSYYLPAGPATKVAVTVNDMISFNVDWNYMYDGSSIPVLAAATVAVDPVTVKVAYDMYSENFGGEVMFSTEVGDGMNLDVMGAMDYNLSDNPAAGTEYVYGLGVAFAAAGATVGVSFDGNDADALADLGVDLNYGLSDALSADVAALFDMTDAATDTFQGLSVSATYAAGAVDYTLGYAYDAAGDGFNYNCETSVVDGGLFMNVQLDF